MILEYQSNGTLEHFLKNRSVIKGTITEEKAAMIFKSLLEAIHNLHGRKYNKIHRDLKPENIYM